MKSDQPGTRQADIATFNPGAGSAIERLLFENRPLILLLCVVMTIFMAFAAVHVKLNASFNEMIPVHQEFIANYLDHYTELQAQGNAIRIVVTPKSGNIIDKRYLQSLRDLSDEVYLLPGVDRPFMTSLWTSSTRWIAVTPNGLDGGPVIDDKYDGSPAELERVRQNIQRTGQVGQLVANDFSSSMIYAPILQSTGVDGLPLDYGHLAKQLDVLRAKYAKTGLTLHIVGFAMVVGDMINGIHKILGFFLASIAITGAALFTYTRCIRSAGLVVTASLVAVIWQMGLLTLLGFQLTPYSVLVPFLVFAIGMSHGAQKMNGVMQDVGRGATALIAARLTFRRLFLAGLAALICDAVSFAVLMTIQIVAIRDLALVASIGVAILVVTNLIMLPILLSYVGVSQSAAERSAAADTTEDTSVIHPVWAFLDLFTRRKVAGWILGTSVLLAAVGWQVGRHVKIGDLDKGAPELRASSEYNRDNDYITRNYNAGADTFIVLVDTLPGHCADYDVVTAIDDLEWRIDQMPQVAATRSIASFDAAASSLVTENSPKWTGIAANQGMLDDIFMSVPRQLVNFQCSFDPIVISLQDHRAETLQAVINTVQTFTSSPINRSDKFTFKLVGGNAGIEAATNIVIDRASTVMLLLVYASVIVFCFIAFRSWRAVLCAVLPLILTSILAQALMVALGIGIKVSTLPVTALGVGIGVDYALYVLSIILAQLKAGATLSQAYYRTLIFTGRVVLLTGFTLSASVMVWIFAPIKFQADMGLLLSFMFIWNMLGALIILPSLAAFILPQTNLPSEPARSRVESLAMR